MRPLSVAAALLLALILSACGSEGVDVPDGDASAEAGAELFAANCAGCHTMTPAGSQGSGNRALRAQGPNFDERIETYEEALYAIQNGGFSGAIMPQNIVVGDEAALVAEFLAKYSGTEIEDSPRPAAAAGTETGEENAAPDSVDTEDEAPGQPGSSSRGGAGSGGQAAGSGDE